MSTLQRFNDVEIKGDFTVGTVTVGTWQGSVITPQYLGTGTRDNTKFLRDDGTWQVIEAGPAASGNYMTEAFTTQTSVVVDHGFGRYPVVNVVDSSGATVIPQAINHTTTSSFTVTFSGVTTGTVIASAAGGEINGILNFIGGTHELTIVSGVVEVDADNGRSQNLLLVEDVSDFQVPTNLPDGHTMIIVCKQDGVGNRVFNPSPVGYIPFSDPADAVLAAGQYFMFTIIRRGNDYLYNLQPQLP